MLVKSGLRMYCLNNMYLSGIHAGIQSKHSGDEVVIKYLLDEKFKNTDQSQMLRDWIVDHKVVTVLNAGHQENLELIYDHLMSGQKQG